MKYRYLIHISYKGTAFRGLQIQKNLQDGLITVQGELTKALQRILRVDNDINLVTSSRTDAGVHAISNTVHVDLDWGNREIPGTNTIRAYTNRQLWGMKLPLRILNIQHVSDEFHCRMNAVGRAYIYKLIISRKMNQSIWLQPFLPVDYDQAYQVRIDDTFNMEKMYQAAERLCGTHNFAAFAKNQLRIPEYVDPVKTMEVTLQPGSTLFAGYLNEYQNQFQGFDLRFKAQSFLYKQVRRMVGAILAIAHNQITMEDLESMLENPYDVSYDQILRYICEIPPHGLYLQEVIYNKEDLKLPSQESAASLSDAQKRESFVHIKDVKNNAIQYKYPPILNLCYYS